MKIAQIAPLYESVPPRYYGGTERVVSYLTEELVRQGHEVTLYASGDSVTRARLVAPCVEALRLGNCLDPLARHILLLEQVFKEVERYDILHFHVDYLHFPLSRRMRNPQVTTLHGRLDLPDLQPLYREFREMPLISISHAQRKPVAWANWKATVHHGLPLDLYKARSEAGSYLAFLGRISPEKRVDRAIEIARRVGIPLRIAAKVDKADREYFENVVEPLLDDPLIEYLGEIGEKEKDVFLGNALALVFPIDWPEPFGLVMIESMACGTPVVAFRCGSVPEVIDPGVTGFVVESIEEAVRAVEQIPSLSRVQCRATFEERFSVTRMAQDYVAIFQAQIDRRGRGARASSPVGQAAGASIAAHSDGYAGHASIPSDTVRLQPDAAP